MRISIVIWSLGPGGAERAATILANKWSELGSVTLFTVESEVLDHYELRNAVARVRYRRRQQMSLGIGNPAVRAMDGPVVQSLLEPLAGLIREVRILTQLRDALRRARPEFVVSFMTGMNNRTMLASLGLGIPVVLSEQIDPRRHQQSMTTRVLRRCLYSRAFALVVLTESLRDWASDYIEASRVWVIPNPIQSATNDLDGERHRIVLGVGRLVRQKGFDILVRAFDKAAGSRPGWRLWLVGSGPELSTLENLANELGIRAHVDFPGTLKDLGSVYAEASVFVLSSRYEGFGNVLVEAMAHGMACVATDCDSGPREIIVDGVDGLLVPVEDVSALSDAIATLMDDPDARTALGDRAKVSALRFVPDRISKRWFELFESIVN